MINITGTMSIIAAAIAVTDTDRCSQRQAVHQHRHHRDRLRSPSTHHRRHAQVGQCRW